MERYEVAGVTSPASEKAPEPQKQAPSNSSSEIAPLLKIPRSKIPVVPPKVPAPTAFKPTPKIPEESSVSHYLQITRIMLRLISRKVTLSVLQTIAQEEQNALKVGSKLYVEQ
ncbi:unnamed protein product [Trichobilharzia regenti]|nr:unnamed protein product [Trichobilharzia regenti]